MIDFDLKTLAVTIKINSRVLRGPIKFLNRWAWLVLALALVIISVFYFNSFYHNGLGLSYNDARSHLDIGRRVVEGLKPGIAQLGSVWLPLDHILMIPTIWNDWMWHTGLAGAIENMVGFVGTGILIYAYLKELKVGLLGRITGVVIFAANLNILYLQSTAMTELLLLFTMTAGCYYLLLWHKDSNLLNLIKAAFWIMLSTLTRYDGWFLLIWAGALVGINVILKSFQNLKTWKEMLKQVQHDRSEVEGTLILFLTLAGFGVVAWFAWNQLIFKDALYFAFGPFSAHAQQLQLSQAGVLATKGDLGLSLKVYLYALLYNTYTFPAIVGLIGLVVLWFEKSKTTLSEKFASSALLAPFVFNVLALFLGFSVLFVQGISGDTWFNVRYGIMLMPPIAIFIGFLIDRARYFRFTFIVALFAVVFFAFIGADAVTIDDARVGSSQKNVSQVSGYLRDNAGKNPGYILISVASHDAIIFSSGLPMSRFIHEGTGLYWIDATAVPDRWARWIVMRTNDVNDLVWKSVSKARGFTKYTKVAAYPFADVYELKPEYVPLLNFTPVFGKQK